MRCMPSITRPPGPGDIDLVPVGRAPTTHRTVGSSPSPSPVDGVDFGNRCPRDLNRGKVLVISTRRSTPRHPMRRNLAYQARSDTACACANLAGPCASRKKSRGGQDWLGAPD